MGFFTKSLDIGRKWVVDMKKWFISDTHFSHKNVISYNLRPFSTVEEMDKQLIHNWNQYVDDIDQVFFLGDFGMGKFEHLHSICSQLKGNKICILGNHDRKDSWMYRIGFNVVLESAFIKIGSHLVELIHIPSKETPPHYQLHGHVHEKSKNKIIDNKLNLCVEVWQYHPVGEDVILSILDKHSKLIPSPLIDNN